MRRKLYIFVLLFLLPQEETEGVSYSKRMVISDALPVQFWLEGCDTFNDSQNYGVHAKCWFQPFTCDDEIKIQIHDDEIGNNTEAVSLPALTAWATRSTTVALIDWTTGASPNVTLNGIDAFNTVASEILYADYPFIAGRQYAVTINYNRVVNSGSSNPRTTTIRILNDTFGTIFSDTFSAGAGANSNTITFTATDDCNKVGISHDSGANVTITVTSTSATISTYTEYNLDILSEDGDLLQSILMSETELATNGYYHSASFSPLDYNICGQRIRLRITRPSSPETTIATTDLLDIQSTHSGTKLISYTNNTNFAGLFYENISPDQVYYIRVPCRFFHERMPQEDDTIELTTSIVTTRSQKKKQKWMEVELAPYYFHNKLIEVFQHQTLTIDNVVWKKEEAYEINPGDKRWPLKTGTCWLTNRGSVVRNVI